MTLAKISLYCILKFQNIMTDHLREELESKQKVIENLLDTLKHSYIDNQRSMTSVISLYKIQIINLIKKTSITAIFQSTRTKK